MMKKIYNKDSYVIPNTPVCPVCKKPKDLTRKAKLFLSISNHVAWWYTTESLITWVKENRFSDPHSERKIIHWACDSCIKSGKAILANPAKQTFSDCACYYAYFDLKRHCRTCDQDYVFTKEEQQFWYEDRSFWVQSMPKDCADCRKERRVKKGKN